MSALRRINRPINRYLANLSPQLKIQRMIYAAGGCLFNNDLSAMYTTSAGITPITAPASLVGLRIDQSRGGEGNLGEERMVNPDFTSGALGWDAPNGGWVFEDNVAKDVSSDNLKPLQQTVSDLTVGQWCRVVISVSNLTGGMPSIKINGNSLGTVFTNNGVHVRFFKSTAVSHVIGIDGANATFWIESCSVKSIPGNHAMQAYNDNRPTWDGGNIIYDGGKSHTVAFPAALGNNCTIAYAVAGVGTTVLTGQTVGTSHTITTNNCGYIIIARALTAAETAVVTEYLDGLAGV